jgi:pimeloyl-ACP methyl ester carboxylesterase
MKPSSSIGALIAYQTVSAPDVDAAEIFLVKYWSESPPNGKLAKVTGLIFVPKGPPPAGGWPIVTWAHDIDGMTGQCAPSADPTTDVIDLAMINSLLSRGWEVTSTDYLGEGNALLGPTTPGLHPLGVGVSAARNLIDIVRAAGHLAAADASTRYVVFGYSEGGQAAMFASQMSASYAPMLSLAGVAAVVPPSQFISTLLPYDQTSTQWPLLYMVAEGYNAGYGDTAAPLNQVLTARGLRLKSILRTQCVVAVYKALSASGGFDSVFSTTTLPPAWAMLATANDPESFTAAGAAPLLIVHGDADTVIPPETSAMLTSHLCSLRQDVERWLYPGLDHNTILSSGMGTDDVEHWIYDRFSGRPNPDPYVPAGEAGITTTTCP